MPRPRRRIPPLRFCAGDCGRQLRSWREHVYCSECLPKFVGTDPGWTRRMRAENAEAAKTAAPGSASPVLTRDNGSTNTTEGKQHA